MRGARADSAPRIFYGGSNNGANDNGRDPSYLVRIMGENSRVVQVVEAAAAAADPAWASFTGRPAGKARGGEERVERENESVAAII